MLNIKEPLLEKYHDTVSNCLKENNIPFECEYFPKDNDKQDPTVSYTIYHNSENPRIGFIGLNKNDKNNFFGVVVKTEAVRYLSKEGFDLDSIIDEEPVYVASECIMAFVCMLAIDRIKDLVFDEELQDEFDRLYQNKKPKPKAKKKIKK